jgi:hypothetical protein
MFEERNLRVHTAAQDALVHRDIDYVVNNGAIEMVERDRPGDLSYRAARSSSLRRPV